MGPIALTCVCVFESGLSTPIRVSLIVAPDSMHTKRQMKGIPFKIFGTSAIGILQHPKCWFSSLHIKVGSHQQAKLSEVPTEFTHRSGQPSAGKAFRSSHRISQTNYLIGK